MFVKDHPAGLDIAHHQLSWPDFDDLARGDGGADVIRRLRRMERSRRLLLLRTLLDEVADDPELYLPLPNPEIAWDLLARAQAAAPTEFDEILAHPYTGAWLVYTLRLARKQITSDWPLWTHIGHLHALAAAAAIRAGVQFDARIPVRHGEAILPTLGMARLPADAPWSVSDLRRDADGVRITMADTEVLLPQDVSEDAPGWWGLRRLAGQEVNGHRIEVRLDDLDPYRGLREPALADRTDPTEVKEWAALLDDAWRLIAECMPTLAAGFPVGLDSLVPRAAVPFRYLSGSTGETFGSAVIAKPPTAALLAAALVHEFQHSRLHALMHMARLHEPDFRERYYTLWRDDPRPVGGVLHGVYAFFGMTRFWHALAHSGDRRALFEFAYCRTGTWRVLQQLRRDPMLTPVGQRFVEGIAERLVTLLDEPIPTDIATLAETAVTDHHAGWRLRHLRPSSDLVATLTDRWSSADTNSDRIELPPDPAPTPEPDGSWFGARTELIRLSLTDPDGASLNERWPNVPGATTADFASITGNLESAISGYLLELQTDADSVPSWAGLGLALSAQCPDKPAARALLTYPELIRAVHRQIRSCTDTAPAPDKLAAWITSALLSDDPHNDWQRKDDAKPPNISSYGI